MIKHFFLIIFLFVINGIVISQVLTSKIITGNNIEKHIKYLSSDSLKGRFPGTPGNDLAADYILNKFKSYGLKPLAENGYQYFEVITEVKTGLNNSFSFENFAGKLNDDFVPFSFSEIKTVEAEVVFAGYGFDISTDDLKWNDYKNIDVKGKWVMIFRGDPEYDNAKSKFIDYALERKKVLTAKDKGAAGVIFITGSSMEKNDDLVPVYFDKTVSTAGLPAINIKRTVADKILSYVKDKGNLRIDSIEYQINKTKKTLTFNVPVRIKASTDVIFTSVKTKNIVALLQGNDTSFKKDFLVLGAHFDHLGMGGQGSGSLEKNYIAVHNGADDNASGVAAIIELSRLLSENRNHLKRSIVFIAFNAEELGMIGSKYFLKSNLIKNDKIDIMFNFDMVGRLRQDTKQLTVSGSGTSLESDSILKKYNKNRIFTLNLSPDGYGPSDQAAFYAENIPVLFFTTGAHEDYHTSGDKVDKINFEGESAIIDYAYDVINDIDNSTDMTFKESGAKHETKGARYKVTLGIIPDVVSSDTKGLKVEGLRKGGPAEKGGILKGDIITSINRQPVSNVYDYMSRLATLKIGNTISVEVLRNNKKEVFLILL